MNETKVKVLLVGVSQLSRNGEAMNRKQGEKVSVIGCVRIEGEHIERNLEEMKETLEIVK